MKITLYETNNILFSKSYKLGKMNARFWKNIQNKGKVTLTVFEISLICIYLSAFAFNLIICI